MKTRTTKRRSATDRREFLASDLAKTGLRPRSCRHETLERQSENLPSIAHSIRTAIAATAAVKKIAGARRAVLLVRWFRFGRGGEFLEARVVPERIEHRIEPE
jgi:hypothetical protein